MALTIITRSQWGARPPRSTASWPSPPTSWTFHYEGSNIPIDQADYSGVVRAIQAYHMDVAEPPNHYSDIAYNFVIAPDGDIFEARGWNVRSGANGTSDSNLHSMAVCYLGGPDTPLTDAAKRSFIDLVAVKPAPHWPHKHWFNTACPGPAVLDWMVVGEPAPSFIFIPQSAPTYEDDDMPAFTEDKQSFYALGPNGWVPLVGSYPNAYVISHDTYLNLQAQALADGAPAQVSVAGGTVSLDHADLVAAIREALHIGA